MRRQALFVLITSVVVGCMTASAQPGGDRHPDGAGGERIRAAHAAYITRRLSLTPNEAQAFWPVYNEYDEQRRALREQWRTFRRNESDDKILLQRDRQFRQQELDLENKYMERFEKILPPEKLIRLRPAEADFRKLVLHQVQKRRRN